MGGHGALTIYLNSIRNGTKKYRSCSAFAPISNPVNCPWGQKALGGYLKGGVEEAKEQYLKMLNVCNIRQPSTFTHPVLIVMTPLYTGVSKL